MSEGDTAPIERLAETAGIGFAGDPAEVGLDALAAAHAAGRVRAAERLPWADSGSMTLAARAAIAHDLGWAVDHALDGFEGHGRSDDGRDVVVPGARLDAAEVGRLMARSGGLVHRDAGRSSPTLARIAADLSAATGDVVEAIGIVGCAPARNPWPASGSTWVAALTAEVVLHDRSGPPLQIEPGQVHRCDGFPRASTAGHAVTAAFVRWAAQPGDRAQVLVQRAAHHPLLRVDLPVDLDDPHPVYGVDGEHTAEELIGSELRSLHGSVDRRSLDRWWRYERPMPLHRLTPAAPTATVQGCLPWGVGVVEQDATTATTVVTAGGTAFRIPEDQMPLLASLLEGGPVTVEGGTTRWRSVLALASAGLVIDADPDEPTA